jgi:hypothetical protein
VSRPSLPTVAAGLLVKAVIDRVPAPKPDARRSREPRPAPGRPKGRLVNFVLASLAVTVVFMIVFHQTWTRVIGVAAMAAFIIGGVFLVASPSFLSDVPEEEER